MARSTELRTALQYMALVAVAGAIIATGAYWGWNLGDDPSQAELSAAAQNYQQLQRDSRDPLAQPSVRESYLDAPLFPVGHLYPSGSAPSMATCYEDSVLVWDPRTNAHTACIPIDDFVEWYRLNSRDRTYFSEILSQGAFEGIKNCPRSVCR